MTEVRNAQHKLEFLWEGREIHKEKFGGGGARVVTGSYIFKSSSNTGKSLNLRLDETLHLLLPYISQPLEIKPILQTGLPG